MHAYPKLPPVYLMFAAVCECTGATDTIKIRSATIERVRKSLFKVLKLRTKLFFAIYGNHDHVN